MITDLDLLALRRDIYLAMLAKSGSENGKIRRAIRLFGLRLLTLLPGFWELLETRI